MHAALSERSGRRAAGPWARSAAWPPSTDDALRRVAEHAPGSQRATAHQAGADFAATPLRAGAPVTAAPQCKLVVGPVDDPLEAEADRVADQVVGGASGALSVTPAPLGIRRACSACQQARDASSDDDPDKALLQRAPAPGAASPLALADGQAARLASPRGGQPLPRSTRRFMEDRFGADFSAVRIHTDGDAHQHAVQLNARAFTIGHDIHFRRGQFDPQQRAGRHLLAHELTHTLQQQGAGTLRLQRKTAAEWDAEAATLQAQVLASPEFNGLDAAAKADVAWIIASATSRPPGDAKGQRLYYLRKLLTALTTPYNGVASGGGYGCSPGTATKNRDVVDAALRTEAKWGGAYADVDERQVAGARKMVERTGEQGKKFKVDGSDPRNVRVKMKVKLNGAPDEVGKVRALEDAIERSISMSTRGYHVDIEFVDKAGPDVFEFTVKFCEWPNSGNWASSPVTLSHEVHHALGLDDRYDYIESHAANGDMNVEMRLHWFVEQMKKTTGSRDAFSKMATSSNPLLAEDVCAVAFGPGNQRNACVQARKSLDAATVPPI